MEEKRLYKQPFFACLFTYLCTYLCAFLIYGAFDNVISKPQYVALIDTMCPAQ
jgi:hypothetical protein